MRIVIVNVSLHTMIFQEDIRMQSLFIAWMEEFVLLTLWGHGCSNKAKSPGQRHRSKCQPPTPESIQSEYQ